MEDMEPALIAQAVLGKEVESFMASDVGKYILARADEEYQSGVCVLKHCSAMDTMTIQEAQNKVWRAESLRQWLEEAVISGLKAHEILEEREF